MNRKGKETQQEIERLRAQNEFILSELAQIKQTLRLTLMWSLPRKNEEGNPQERQTRESFEYQWREFSEGVAMSDDKAFMAGIKNRICEITDCPPGWFPGKTVADVGCGAGRYSHGLLSLGAEVSSFDQSPSALEKTRILCSEYLPRHKTACIDVLSWDSSERFDMVFCFGVAHHTGNTYLAVKNIAEKTKPGGRLFLMLYGFPKTPSDFLEVNSHERLRAELRNLSFEEKKETLTRRFGAYDAHGWFDAISPEINDLLTFEEIESLLKTLGFRSIRRTQNNRNHHVVAEKI